jgi:hypothetical protein
LLLASRSGAHVHLGYGSFSQYVERLLGYSPRATREKLRVAEALERLPLSARALEQGELGWCAVRELTRVATADTEPAWLDAARGKTTRELEQLVASKRPGELPPRPDVPQPPRRHVLRFEVTPETFATFREATLSLQRAAGGTLDDDALLLEMARRALGASTTDPGRSSYRISFERCPACGDGAQIAGGERVAVSTEVLDMAACDAEQLVVPAPRPANQNHVADHAPAATEVTHVGRVAHARQAVPPALRRAVLARDRHRCSVPGCTHTHFVDVHHVRPRSAGGRNTLANLITLCTAHHRAVHRGELVIEPSPAGFSYRHADGTPYGQPVAAEPAAAYAKVFATLRHLGFREHDVQAVLTELRGDPSLQRASTELLLREALRNIRPT